MEFTQFLATLRAAPRVYIQTHDFPDADAIGSACGVQRILRHFGIDARICYQGSIHNDATLHILKEYDLRLVEASHLGDMTLADKILLVDGQKLNANMTDLPGDEVACIDHHPDNEKVALAYEDIRPCGACASIVAEYFRLLDVPLDQKTATLLLYGLQMDTGNLQRGVTPLDIAAFGQLFPLADVNMLQKLAVRTMREKDLRAFGTAIETIAVAAQVGIAFIPFACDDHLIAQIADFILAMAEVDTAIVYSLRDNGLKFSARTLLPEVHCGNLLQKCLEAEGGSGGGHPHMAGGFIPRGKIPSLYEENQSWETRKYTMTEFRKHLAERIAKCTLARNQGEGTGNTTPGPTAH